VRATRIEPGKLSEWYLDIIKKAELADYAPVKGCMVIRPYGFAIWENLRDELDRRIKTELGCSNACFPLLIPESFLHREKEHVEGFAPECAVVTHGGGALLEEPLVVRPTSETVICSMYAKWISSWRDLPMLVNQWANVVRWEKRTLPFLRTTEFLWQEGHTVHASAGEAEEMTARALEVYRDFLEGFLAIPVVVGRKTESEKFAGAVYTSACEAYMPDGKALQSATSHYFGTNFSRPFEIRFQDRDGELLYGEQTSWGLSTRVVGGTVMVHGDSLGLKLPPNVAPVQVVIVPIFKTDAQRTGVLEAADRLAARVSHGGVRVKLDAREGKSPGWRFADWEMRGVPIRVEIGPRDLAAGEVVVARRDTLEKDRLPFDAAPQRIPEILAEIQRNLFEAAKHFRDENTVTVTDYGDFADAIKTRRPLIHASWCGNAECEAKVKQDTKATTRVIPSEGASADGKCIVCGRPASCTPIWARAY